MEDNPEAGESPAKDDLSLPGQARDSLSGGEVGLMADAPEPEPAGQGNSDKKKSRRECRVGKFNPMRAKSSLLFLGEILAMGAILYQGYYIWKQSNTSAEQLSLSRQTEEFSILTRLANDNLRIQQSVYDPNGVFEVASRNSCHPVPAQFLDSKSTDIEVRKVITHYELYYEAARRKLISADEWSSICRGAKKLFESNCFLASQWSEKYSKSEPDEFKDSFIPSCELKLRNLDSGGSGL